MAERSITIGEIARVAAIAAETSSNNHTTLIFTDGSISVVMGGWSSKKELWLSIYGEYTEEELIPLLIDAL